VAEGEKFFLNLPVSHVFRVKFFTKGTFHCERQNRETSNYEYVDLIIAVPFRLSTIFLRCELWRNLDSIFVRRTRSRSFGVSHGQDSAFFKEGPFKYTKATKKALQRSWIV